jgi:hypothetical protein
MQGGTLPLTADAKLDVRAGGAPALRRQLDELPHATGVQLLRQESKRGE